MVTFDERDNMRERSRGQPARYSPTRRKEPNRFVQEVKALGNDVRQLGVNTSGVLQNNPLKDTIQKAVDYGRDTMFPSIWGAGIEGIKNLTRNQAMHGQNKNYFDGNFLDDKIPDNVRESLMTQKDQDFYDKYMMLAEREQDRTRKQEYLDTAETARRNAQITGRLNYGLSQIDDNIENEYINSEGLPSYFDDNFNNEGQSRLDMDAFRDAMGIENLDMMGSDSDLVERDLDMLGSDPALVERDFGEYGGRSPLPEFPINQSQSLLDEGNNNEEEIQMLRDQIMGNPATTDFGNLEDLYGIKANTFDPESYLRENEPTNIETGIFENSAPEPSKTFQESNIIQQVIKENPFMMKVFGNDYMGMRAYLFDIGVLDPNSDLYKQTSNLEYKITGYNR